VESFKIFPPRGSVQWILGSFCYETHNPENFVEIYKIERKILLIKKYRGLTCRGAVLQETAFTGFKTAG
jgi:hypothetical protein